jgi:hypothetical protein
LSFHKPFIDFDWSMPVNLVFIVYQNSSLRLRLAEAAVLLESHYETPKHTKGPATTSNTVWCSGALELTPIRLLDRLSGICRAAFDFPAAKHEAPQSNAL